MSPAIFDAMAVTRSFLFEHLYLGKIGHATGEAVQRILQTLLEHHAAAPDHNLAPDGEAPATTDPIVRAVDYVAGMTDRFAIRAFETLVEGPSGLHALG
jgi:dGTPase